MKTSMLSKGLAVAVIILFLSVGIQPATGTVETEEETIVDSSNCSNNVKSVIFEQLPFGPDESWIFRISDADAGYRVWDDFWDITAEIGCISWWGLSLSDYDNWTSCDPEGMVFEIIVWDALLGNPVCLYQGSPCLRETFEFYNGSKMFYWIARLDPSCDYISDGWVSIQSLQSTNQCWLLWASSDEGDLYCYQEGATAPDGDSDCAFQLTAEGEPAYPDINCDPVGMNFGKAGPGATVTGQIYVCNNGDAGSYLNWYVDTAAVPDWGTWTFSPAGGTGVAEGDCDIIDVTCVLTEEKGSYNGEITVYNADDSTDYCKIDTSAEVPRARTHNAIWNLLQQFPALYQILEIIFGA